MKATMAATEKPDIEELKKTANDLRIDVIKITTNAGTGHVTAGLQSDIR